MVSSDVSSENGRRPHHRIPPFFPFALSSRHSSSTTMSSRVGFRFLNNSRFAFRNAQGPFRRPGAQGRRFQSSDAGAAEQQSTFQRLWNSPVGVKTVHFW